MRVEIQWCQGSLARRRAWASVPDAPLSSPYRVPTMDEGNQDATAVVRSSFWQRQEHLPFPPTSPRRRQRIPSGPTMPRSTTRKGMVSPLHWPPRCSPSPPSPDASTSIRRLLQKKLYEMVF